MMPTPRLLGARPAILAGINGAIGRFSPFEAHPLREELRQEIARLMGGPS
jgi:hypothetical protein